MDWDGFFRGLDGAAAGDGATASEPARRGWFVRLRENLGRSSRAMAQGLAEVAFDPADEAVWERLEEALISADVGVPATVAIVGELEAAHAAGAVSTPDQLRSELVRITAAMLQERDPTPGLAITARPTVLLVIGVNGTGKTTSIGKLSYRLHEAGASVVVGAADTFRAAAGEQLEIWADRAEADYVGSAPGGDPAAVAYDAVSAAEARGRDVVVVDTAGRLHTQDHLMAELGKVHRVIAQRLDGAPHETLLVIDATTGQNGLQQARLFSQAAEVTGVVLTKLDGTAKGGIAIAIAHELGIPIKLIGIGEALEDLRPFDADDFAHALFDGSQA
jgi:fused signal recognition particle receptor